MWRDDVVEELQRCLVIDRVICGVFDMVKTAAGPKAEKKQRLDTRWGKPVESWAAGERWDRVGKVVWCDCVCGGGGSNGEGKSGRTGTGGRTAVWGRSVYVL